MLIRATESSRIPMRPMGRNHRRESDGAPDRICRIPMQMKQPRVGMPGEGSISGDRAGGELMMCFQLIGVKEVAIVSVESCGKPTGNQMPVANQPGRQKPGT